MKRRQPISEAHMLDAEARFPELAAQAGRAAHERTLASTGRVVKAIKGQVIEAKNDGSIRVLQQLPPATPVKKGLVLVRRGSR
jgi:hypothetical protein